ncbi:MAG: carboxypeptidase-like regulatory domain-containing protein, partial [Gammaproteobacteria bacterium]|nr:carboxypeptidase-like regulatory domain-containing protein [Gammaproteobacteria bacterium]
MNQFCKLSYLVRGAICTAVFVWATVAGSVALAAGFQGQVTDANDGTAIVGAMVTARFGEPFQERTVFTDDEGRYSMAGLPAVTNHRIRVR